MFYVVEVDDGQIKLVDASGNIVTTTDLGSGKRGIDVNAILAADGKIIIRDGSNADLLAKVNESGYLYVTAPPDVTPPGKTEVFRNARGDVNGSSYSDDVYVIPNGVTLNLSHFEGGFKGSSYDSCVTLYYTPNGSVDSSAIILAHGYCASSNYQKTLTDVFTGNGTRAIIARRERLDGTKKEGYFMWKGWY